MSEKDVIFTEAFLYEKYIKGTGVKSPVIIRDAYGMGEPDDGMIDAIAEVASQKEFERVIAVGGGSVIDIGKIMALKENRPVSDLFLKRREIEKEKKLVIVPTTCGTGSEMTNLSIAHIREKETKLGIADDGILADDAVLIPELVEGLPQKFFVCSAIDAMVHAAESYVSPKANDFTETFSLKAFEMILSGFGQLIRKGQGAKKKVAGEFLTASTMAGIAFGNAGVGAVHALAYPLGGNYHVAHGETNYQFFGEVFELYQREKASKKLEELSGLIENELGEVHCGKGSAFGQLNEMLMGLIPLKPLREYGMREEEVETFARSVMENQQRLLVNSPIKFTEEHAKAIYRKRY